MQSTALYRVQESVQSDFDVSSAWGCAAVPNTGVCRWVFNVKIPGKAPPDTLA